MQGKAPIDVGNPREDREGPMTNESLAEAIGLVTAEVFTGTRVVKTLLDLSPGR